MFVLFQFIEIIVNIINTLPDETRFAVCDVPGFVSTLVDNGYTVFEDCSITRD